MGAPLTTWVTFAPCILWIFAFAPWLDRLEDAKRLKGGLAALTAAVVGVIGNLTVWFLLHVLFARIHEFAVGPLRLYDPEWSTFDWRAAFLALISAVLIFRLKWNVIKVLGVAAACGLALAAIG